MFVGYFHEVAALLVFKVVDIDYGYAMRLGQRDEGKWMVRVLEG